MNPVHVKGIYLQNEVQPVIVLRQAREVTLTLAEGESPMSAIGQKEFMTLKCTNQNSLKSSSEKLTWFHTARTNTKVELTIKPILYNWNFYYNSNKSAILTMQ